MSRKVWISALLTLISIAIITAGIFFWQQRQEKRNLLASEVFSHYVEAKPETKHQYLEALSKNFSNTPYYPRALFLAAQEEKDQAKAEKMLKDAWQASKDPYLHDTIALNIAARLDPQSKEVMDLLTSSKTEAMTPFFLELKGDILMHKKDFSGARKAYEAALAAKKFSENYTLIVERKLSRVPL